MENITILCDAHGFPIVVCERDEKYMIKGSEQEFDVLLGEHKQKFMIRSIAESAVNNWCDIHNLSVLTTTQVARREWGDSVRE